MLETALMCLAMNVYYEARSEPFEAQITIAQVTMNRVKAKKSQFGKGVCGVVTKPHQFSWVEARTEKVYVNEKLVGRRLIQGQSPKEKKAWQNALFVARLVLSNSVGDFSKGALFYHTKQVSPKWKPPQKYIVADLGNHLFYEKSKSQVSYN